MACKLRDRIDLCVVASPGGHLTEVRMLSRAFNGYSVMYVLNSPIALDEDLDGITYFVTHATRSPMLLVNCAEAIVIFLRHRPRVMISTGASVAIPFMLVSKVFRVKTIFLETITRHDQPSLTARLAYYLADHFFYQWEDQKVFFPRGKYRGQVL